MKKILLLFLLLSFSFIQGQSWKDLTTKQKNDTDRKNELSKYFKKKIPKVLLKDIFFNKNEANLVVSFFINNENLPYGIRLNSYRNRELNNEIKEALKKLPLQKLNLKDLNKNKQYFFQIISKNGRKNIINCSNTIFSKTLPYKDKWSDVTFYEDIESCIQEDIKKYFYDSLDFSLAENLNDNKQINISLSLLVDKNGVLKANKIKAPDVFINNINKTIKSYPKFDSGAKIENINSTYNFRFSIFFKKGEQPEYKNWRTHRNTKLKGKTDNDFSKYLAKKISLEDLNIANLNRIKNTVTLSFESDKTNTPFNISTTSRSDKLDKKIIDALKTYPIEKLGIQNNNRFNKYFIQILIFENNQTRIKTFDKVIYERAPIFPGCENAMSIKNLKQCFSKNIQMHFAKKFDTSLPKTLGLSKGRKRIFIAFKIGAEGKIKDINVRAPHPKIKAEVIKVMKTLPMVKPGIQNSKKINLKYSIPFTLIVD